MRPQERHSQPARLSKGNHGFSLIEVLIVVAIILIIAAIAIPNLIRAKIAANEAAAISNMRTINTAAVSYSTTYINGYPPTLASLGPDAAGDTTATCVNAALIDEVIAGGTKSGYVFTYTGTGAPFSPIGSGCGAPGYNSYVLTAIPVSVGMTGSRSFCATDDGVLRYDLTGAQDQSAASCGVLPALN
jgi:type IV pilus assembly protein PilA